MEPRSRKQPRNTPSAGEPVRRRGKTLGAGGPPPEQEAPTEPPAVPRWDGTRRTLTFGDLVVKHFLVLAPNQQLVLEAFQEQGWPPRIDDPLPRDAKHDAKRRLHETIRSLNRNQAHPLIRFSGDGTGTGICWEPR